jgi:hypothetical protein
MDKVQKHNSFNDPILFSKNCLAWMGTNTWQSNKVDGFIVMHKMISDIKGTQISIPYV